MAGFWTGLVHGTLMCGATLAALSLAFPRDAGDGRDGMAVVDRTPEPSPASARAESEVTSAPEAPSGSIGPDSAPARPEPLATEPAPVLSPPQDAEGRAAALPATKPGEPSATPGPAAPGTASPPAAPAASVEDASAGPAERLPDPIGSDFRRGSDDPPSVPAVSPAPVERHVPRSVAASEEALPPPALMPGEVPPVSTASDAPGLLAPDSFEPEPLSLPLDEPAMTIAAPGRAEAPALDRRPETGTPDAAAQAVPVAADRGADDSQAAAGIAATRDSADEGASAPPSGTALAARQAASVGADASAATSPIPDAADDDAARQPIPDASTADAIPGRQAAVDQPAASGASAPAMAPDGPMPARPPRPAPDLSIPRALLAPGSARRAPALPQPAAATPPGPDLSDINPGASR